MTIESIFPHPLTPRSAAEFTPAEAAYFREANRLLRTRLGPRIKLILSDQTISNLPTYRLTVKWADPEGKRRQISGFGITPGEALWACLAIADQP